VLYNARAWGWPFGYRFLEDVRWSRSTENAHSRSQFRNSSTLDGERERSISICGSVRKSNILDGEREHSVFGSVCKSINFYIRTIADCRKSAAGAMMQFQARAPQRFSPSTTYIESRWVHPWSTKFDTLSEWESLFFSFVLIDCFWLVHLMLLNALNATLQTLRSGWFTDITNAAIAMQVDQLVAFVAMYEFLLHES